MNLDLFKLWVWNRALPTSLETLSQHTEQNLLPIEGILEPEETLGRSPHLLLSIRHKESLLMEETQDLLLKIEVGLRLHQNIQSLFGLEG